MNSELHWEFPLTRTHCGILLGNARMGVMLWGQEDTLRITVGRADLWDHRGGMQWTDKQSYNNIRTCLEREDREGLNALFRTDTEGIPGQPSRPSVIPVGRIDLHLPQGSELRNATLNIHTGQARICYRYQQNDLTLELYLSMEFDLLVMHTIGNQDFSISNHPSWQTLGDNLKDRSFTEPEMIPSSKYNGWIQKFPSDPDFCLLYEKVNTGFILSTAKASDGRSAFDAAESLINAYDRAGSVASSEASCKWWREWWKETPEISIPNKIIEESYYYGMYKFAGLAQPEGVAATLQGPWVEDYQLPPWSNDYHFNINVQMCYWPAYKGNHLDCLRPLFDLIFSWEDTLIDNARKFAGVKNGRMLPHAVDDRCTCMGGFWTGSIDHACTAWISQMMFDYALYKPDFDFLRAKVLPFMRGTMDVFVAMLEKDADGIYSLPVSVSPEYGGAHMKAWGRNSSFQLAAIHRLCDNLQRACDILKIRPDPVWADIMKNLPKCSLADANENLWADTEKNNQNQNKKMIALWEGCDLDESHRHHSHLAGLYPFDSFDASDDKWREIISESVRHWISRGMGKWTGWSMPWAAILHSRLRNGRMAELILEVWNRVFTNYGRGTLHDPDFRGLTLMGHVRNYTVKNTEIMQMDAGMGVCGAILEMFVSEQRGILHIMEGMPENWKECSFKGIRASGGILIDGCRSNYSTTEILIRAKADTIIKMKNPFSENLILVNGEIMKIDSVDSLIIFNAVEGESYELCGIKK